MEGCHRSDVVTVRLQESGDSLTGVRQLVAGARHVCAITESDEVVCWGDNAEGQLGSRAGARISQGVRLPFSGTARKLALGASHTCLLSAEGRVRCWGAHGLDGDASQGGVRDIVTGHDHTCLLNKRGEVHCWGTNDRGQLGRNETSQSETRPAAVLSR